MTKIFYGYSTKGDIAILSIDKINQISNIILKLKLEILPKEKTDGRKISQEKIKDKTKMHDEEYKKLINCDAAIFEITNPGITIGAQISDLIHMGKPTLCLYKNDMYNIIPRYIIGKENSSHINTPLIITGYSNEQDIKTIIQEFIKNYVE